MRVQWEYDVNVLATNHHSINWLSCIVNGPEKTNLVLQTEICHILAEPVMYYALQCRFSAKALQNPENPSILCPRINSEIFHDQSPQKNVAVPDEDRTRNLLITSWMCNDLVLYVSFIVIYQDERMIMKGSVKRSTIQSQAEFHL